MVGGWGEGWVGFGGWDCCGLKGLWCGAYVLGGVVVGGGGGGGGGAAAAAAAAAAADDDDAGFAAACCSSWDQTNDSKLLNTFTQNNKTKYQFTIYVLSCKPNNTEYQHSTLNRNRY